MDKEKFIIYLRNRLLKISCFERQDEIVMLLDAIENDEFDVEKEVE